MCWIDSQSLKFSLGIWESICESHSLLTFFVLSVATSTIISIISKFKLEPICLQNPYHSPYDIYRIDHKLDRSRFPNMPMRKDKLVRDYFGDQLFITTSGHFSTPALHCAMGEVGVQSIMFSIDYPFESIPNACGKSISYLLENCSPTSLFLHCSRWDIDM